jgi:starvation-inducible DNA-binding protein
MRTGVPTLETPIRETVASDLQATLVDLVALSLHGKQAHWHVTGPNFVPVHEQVDELVNDTREWADLVAERAVTLGVAVDGRPETVAGTSEVETFPEGFVGDLKAVSLVADRLAGAVERLRGRVDRLGEQDLVTQDLVIEILRGLEKHLWMLRAQLA